MVMIEDSIEVSFGFRTLQDIALVRGYVRSGETAKHPFRGKGGVLMLMIIQRNSEEYIQKIKSDDRSTARGNSA